jgi:hypothetical protein
MLSFFQSQDLAKVLKFCTNFWGVTRCSLLKSLVWKAVQLKPGVSMSVECCVTSEQTVDTCKFQTRTIQNILAPPGDLARFAVCRDIYLRDVRSKLKENAFFHSSGILMAQIICAPPATNHSTRWTVCLFAIVIKYNAMKTSGGWMYRPTYSWPPAVLRSEWPASRSCHFNP